MHSYTGPKGTTFHFNGDLSGEVEVEANATNVSTNRVHHVPVEDILALVAYHYVLPRRISLLEELRPEELLLFK